MKVTNYGATLMKLQVPNKQGSLTNVVVGLPNTEDYTKQHYQKHNFYMGATIGRYAGRISKGGFTINKTHYPLDDEIMLHGGKKGYDKRLWTIEEVQESNNPYVLFSLKSNDGANGFPGNLKVFAKYQLVENALKITYGATTDTPTVINLTNHSYFNLEGQGSVAGNNLFVNAKHILETNDQLIPTGRIMSVENTAYQYLQRTPLVFNGHSGLDTPFVLKEGKIKASIYAKKTGIEMQVATNQPCMVLFTPQRFPAMGILDGSAFTKFPAICFECQNYPDAPNQPNFPSTVLLPGETYLNEIGYHFTVR